MQSVVTYGFDGPRVLVPILLAAFCLLVTACDDPARSSQPATPTATPAVSSDLPDLALTTIRATFPPPAGNCIRDFSEIPPFSMTICVTNQGHTAAGPFSVRIDGSITDRVKDGLGAGAEICLKEPYVRDGQITVDALAEVEESDEDNNRKPFSNPIPTPPRLCATETPTGAESPTPALLPTVSPSPTVGIGAPCHDSSDCGAFVCIEPGGTAGCGVCQNIESQCDADADCASQGSGLVCTRLRPPPCPCSGAMLNVCAPACQSDEECDVGEICDGTGHCVARSCASDGDCPLQFSCESPEGGGSPICQRRHCESDADCTGGFCVLGSAFAKDTGRRCYGELGTCTALPP